MNPISFKKAKGNYSKNLERLNMNWYKSAQLNKSASLTLYVNGFQPQYQQFKDLLSLSFFIAKHLFNNIMSKYDLNYYKEFKEKYSQIDTITPDGNDYFKPIGIMNFYLEGIDPNRTQFLTQKILELLKENQVITGETKLEKSGMFKDTNVVRIPILSNPKAEKADLEDTPPEINMGNLNMHFIMNKVLRYDRDLWENNTFDAKELKKRIEYYLGEHTLPEGEFAGQPYIGQKITNKEDIKEYFSPENMDMLSGKSAISNYTEEQVRSKLSEMLMACNWAINHGYNELFMM